MKLFFRKLLMRFKTPLPQGLTEFESWSDSIIEAFDVPNNASVKFSLATMVLHLGQTESRKAKAYFGACLRKAAANEVAAFVMQDLKAKQKAAQKEAEEKEAKEKQAAEATSAPTELVPSNEQPN